MYLFYEVFNEGSPDPEDELYEFIMSSNGRSNKVEFFNKNEKTNHTIITQIFKSLPLAVCDTDARTYMRTVIGAYSGKKVLALVESFNTSGLLKGFELKKITNLQANLAKGNLSHREPAPSVKKERGTVEIKFKEEDFFYKTPILKGELYGDALYASLASMLNVSIDVFKSLNPQELKKLYRLRAMVLHPDRNNGNGDKMAELNKLWSIYNASIQ